ncbi:TorD/DmsD family molecular chaperone [Halosimplex amylolyticum]|uniref:TorD/DmsD family molecular chaperone n=1 Tax=Halosimplex amylolyticum TaxID=3396616 RepID=UPI003F55422A
MGNEATDGRETADTRDQRDGTTDDGAVASARADVYGLLAATFDGDVESLESALADGTFARLADELPVDARTEALDRTDLDARALRVGYDNLFVVPGPRYVPPFASAHRDAPSESFDSDSPYHGTGNAGELLGDPAAAAAHAHAAAGFEPTRGDGLPDHLAASFEFMRALCEREATALREPDAEAADEVAVYRELQAETVARLDWLDEFHEAVERADSVEGTFAALARFARTFVAWDARAGMPTA